MKYYIATRLEAADRHRQLRDALAERGHEITYDWTQHGSVRHEGPERTRQVAHAEKQGVHDADFVVVLLPGGRGTHSELGLALGAGKRVFIVADIAEGAWAPDERTCAFYHDDLVYRVEYNSQVLPWPEYVHNLANTIHAEVATRSVRGTIPEATPAEQLRYLHDLARLAFEANLAYLHETDPIARAMIDTGGTTWDRLHPVQRDAWIAAVGMAVSEIRSEMEAAVEQGHVKRIDSPLATVATRAASLSRKAEMDRHYATTRRAGVVAQPPPVNKDDRETWPLVVEDTREYLPDDKARALLRGDMRERHRLGKHRYGVALSPHNGRDSLVDAYQEALDKVVYLKNALVELGDREATSPEERERVARITEEYGEALLAAHRLRALVGTRDVHGGPTVAAP